MKNIANSIGRKQSVWTVINKNKYLYILLLPMVIYYIVFAYMPMPGIILAFKNFDYSKGIFMSPWYGFQNFKELVTDSGTLIAFRNTILISIGRLVIEFPVPIILALLLNEISGSKLKKIYQTVFTFPHFLSWVILSGIIVNFLSNDGTANQLMVILGFEKTQFMTNSTFFSGLIFISNIWKEAGWQSILYLAAIASINPELYEAAEVDGANRWHRVKAITWPTIKTTALILIVLTVGNMMNGGFDQIFNLYNPIVFNTADILDTFIYRKTFVDASGYGFTTAVGLVKSVVNFALLVGVDRIVKSMSEEGGL